MRAAMLVVAAAGRSRNGGFSDPDVSFAGLTSGPCQLRAVPAGTTKNQPSFSGPVIVVDEIQSYTLSGPPNNGVEYDYQADANQLAVDDTLASAGSCGLDGGLLDSAYEETTSVFDCDALLSFGNLDGPSSTRSEVQVDGQNAYAPAAAEQVFSNSDSTPGLETLTASLSQNATTGAVTVQETEPFVRCPLNIAYPPSAGTCTSFSATGVRLGRTLTQTGHLVTVADSFSSTDGQRHTLDLLYQNGVILSSDGIAYLPDIGYELPGQSAYTAHALGDTAALSSGAGTILIKDVNAADGDPFTGQAAVTYSTAPSQIEFISPACNNASDFTLHYTGTVPATGSLTYKFVYSQDYTFAALQSEALGAQDAFASPAIAITSPHNGAVTHSSTATIAGTATDLVGISSLTVNGKAVSVGANGSFGTQVTLRSGSNKFTATAKNDAGNSATATVQITYKPLVCKVPKLAGKTLRAAKSALKKANCATGKVTKTHSKTVKSGRVVSSKPKAGSSHSKGTKVALTLSSGP